MPKGKRKRPEATRSIQHLVELLDSAGLPYELVDGDRLPQDLNDRNPDRRWLMVNAGDKLIAIEPDAIATVDEFMSFLDRARSILNQPDQDESNFHPDEYWGVCTIELPVAPPDNVRLVSPERLEALIHLHVDPEAVRPSKTKRTEEHILMRVGNALRTMGWKAMTFEPKDESGRRTNIIAEDRNGRRVMIECKNVVRAEDIVEFARTVRRYSALAGPDRVYGAMLVGAKVQKAALNHPGIGNDFNVYTLEGLEELANKQEWDEGVQAKAKTKKPRTRVGKAVAANADQLLPLLHAFDLLLDEKIASLHAERPNSDDARVQRSAELVKYEELKRTVEAMSKAVGEFTKKAENEPDLEKRAKSLRDGVQQWWDKDSDKICDRSFNTALFLVATGVLGLAGTAIAAAGAGLIFGRKPYDVVMEKLSKKWK